MKTNHTPGPWRVGKTDDGKLYVDCAGLPVICVEQYRNGHEANAKLISAAPELLIAAKDALESLKRLPDAEGAFRATCIYELEHAIAKATDATTPNQP